MKKTIFGLLFILGALSLRANDSANDSYIYWLQGTAQGDGTLDPLSGTYTARLVAMKGSDWVWGNGTYLDLYRAGEGGTPNPSVKYDTAIVDLTTARNNVPLYGNITSLGSGTYTYFIELFNEQNQIFARSLTGLSLTEDSPYVYTTDTAMALPANGFSAPVFTAATPEPTSGMLLLLGSALLALRRKRR